jgi:hypothetical protein
LTKEYITRLNNIASSLDDEYFYLKDLGDADINKSGVMLFFSQDRAISALAFSGDRGALYSAIESIYYASAAAHDADELFYKLIIFLI